jgi:pyruvate dehydrogenase E1 component beta subunit
MAKLNLVKALNLALLQEMERDEDVLVMGEDVGVDGGVFRVTEDLHRKFGSKRVIDSPLAEAAIIGAGVGMALYGLKPVCEIQFSGFAFQCFHQIENHVARYRMRSQSRFHVPMVIRMPYGGGVRALEHHSESEEQFYAHIPGLKMVIPSGPRNARALLVSAIRDPDPVIFFEHKGLYHAAKEDVPDEIETLPIGQAQVVREGHDLTLIAYGAMLRVAHEAAHGRGDLHRRLVRLDLQQRRVLGDRVPLAHQHLPDLRLGQPLAKIRKHEVPRHGHLPTSAVATVHERH